MKTEHRRTLLEWISEITDCFHYPEELLEITAIIFDKYITQKAVERYDAISINDLSFLSMGAFTSNELIIMEMIVLLTLRFNLNPPTMNFYKEYLMAICSFDNEKEISILLKVCIL
ncbi:hypothetical protein ROZALSC1DRAFT_26796 [Rozella allomycis CSF55]|uniref:Uncharacterized protein n=1 Tax=Rozella allomycis (strain CSF55) TaxID=988480 RepID=A0A075AZN3_ROZAC|nr:hypothetical protein O9G_005167 [Rozella allomycis CSF55]RKP21829.1 hypothetical protein ROZALSC1DRAFT_26796 [Rozella allomycis CSF55]|eukprot:EPZ35723.1 hypothetical protein O9G_005167 [Rozella allomycis CSF55]